MAALTLSHPAAIGSDFSESAGGYILEMPSTAGVAAGGDATPPFPGQDFISPATDLVGGKVVISVEPDPDNGAGPFFIKPLLDDVTNTGRGGFQRLAPLPMQIAGSAQLL